MLAMLYTVNFAMAGGPKAEAHARRLQAATQVGDAAGDGRRWRESKTPGQKERLNRRPV